MNQRKIIFFHLPKTAGTSVKRALLSTFGEDKVNLIYGRETFDEKVEDFRHSQNMLGIGHMPWKNVYKDLLKDYRKVTFLRHPLERTVSHYLHVKYSDNADHKVFKELSLPDFLKTHAGSNDMTRRLGGGFYEEGISATSSFSEAVYNVSERFDFVGITESLDQQWSALAEVFKTDLKPIQSFNKGTSPSEAKSLKLQFENEILEANSLDLKLYEIAHKRWS